MSELDDKVAHLRQDMSLHRRQLENKRGDDEVSAKYVDNSGIWWTFSASLPSRSQTMLVVREVVAFYQLSERATRLALNAMYNMSQQYRLA